MPTIYAPDGTPVMADKSQVEGLLASGYKKTKPRKKAGDDAPPPPPEK